MKSRKTVQVKITPKMIKRTLKPKFSIDVLINEYAYESLPVAKEDEENMSCFERIVLRRIYGLILEDGAYKMRKSSDVL